jgi:hypothetical protein
MAPDYLKKKSLNNNHLKFSLFSSVILRFYTVLKMAIKDKENKI